MAKRLLMMVIAVASIATSVSAQEPFGFALNKHPKEYGYCKQMEENKTFYDCSSAPRPHRAFAYYLVQYVEGVGVCTIKGSGVPIHNDAYGIHLRSTADNLYAQVAQRYGPTKKIDLIHPSSLWNEPQYWTMGLRRGDRVYSYLWPPEGGVAPVGQVSSIGVITMALSSDAGYILLTYEFATMPACEAKIQQAESRVF